MITFIEAVTMYIDAVLVVDAVYMSFDRVAHKTLIKGKLANLIQNWFSNRKQCVTVDVSFYDWKLVVYYRDLYWSPYCLLYVIMIQMLM